MKKLPIKILTISWDPTLAMDNPTFGDVQKRNIDYGRYVENIFSVTYAKRSLGLKEKRLSDNVVAIPTNSTNPIAFIFDAWKLARNICRENKIDLVLTQDPFLTGLVGLWVKKNFGCKLLIHYHGDFWHNSKWLKEKWYNFIFNYFQRLVLKKADALRVMSEGQREKFIKTGWLEKRIRVISTPVDLSKFDRLDLGELKNTISDKKVLHIGRNDKVKDYDTLVKSWNIVSSYFNGRVIFQQIGASEEMARAINNQKEINLSAGIAKFPKIESLGLKEQDYLIKQYYLSDVVILSSTSESFGKVLVEANACGKPVVSTATTGAQEIIKDGVNGFLVPIGDAEALAKKTIWLLENTEKSKEIGNNGKKMMKDKFGHNSEKVVQFWDDIIKDFK